MERMMAPDDFVNLVLQVVKDNIDPSTRQVTLALVGDRLKTRGYEGEWRSQGYGSLLRFCEFLCSQHPIELVKTVKGAWAIQLNSSREAVVETVRPSAGFVPLHRQVWWAFVLATPLGLRFIHRVSGEVRLGQGEPPSPAADWVEIERVSDATQKSWATTFLSEVAVENSVNASLALERPTWVYDFPEVLGSGKPDDRVRWNRVRSQRVSEVVRQWSQKHGVPRELLFQVPLSPRVQSKPSFPATAPESLEWRRKVVLKALESLSTERLLEIPIPAATLLSALQAVSTTHK